jgi:hypothetical protein
MLFLRIELLDKPSDLRRDRSRESVVLDLQAVPKRQPDASIANKDRPISRGSVHPISADPVVEVVGCLNRRVETALSRRRGGFGPMRSPGGAADCRHGDAPLLGATFLAPRQSGRGTGQPLLVPLSTPTTQRTAAKSGSRHFIKAASRWLEIASGALFWFQRTDWADSHARVQQVGASGARRWLSLRRGLRPPVHC